MNKLVIEETVDTPKISFDREADAFEIAGKSYPDNVFSFYEPVFTWLNNYVKEPKEKTVLSFKLDYFNTATAKVLFDVLSLIDQIYIQGRNVTIKWYYKEEDEDMKEAGESYKKLIKAPVDVLCL